MHAGRRFHGPTFLASLELPPSDPKFPFPGLLHIMCAIGSLYTADIPQPPMQPRAANYPCAYSLCSFSLNSSSYVLWYRIRYTFIETDPSLCFRLNCDQRTASSSPSTSSSRAAGGHSSRAPTRLRSSRPSSRRLRARRRWTVESICWSVCRVSLFGLRSVDFKRRGEEGREAERISADDVCVLVV